MPSVLVELGYISNKEEREYLMSADGRIQTAKAVYESFTKFKKEYDNKSGKQKFVNDKNKALASAKATEKPSTVNINTTETEKLEIPTEKQVVVAEQPKKLSKEEELQTQQFLDKMKAEANIKEDKPQPKIEPIVQTDSNSAIKKEFNTPAQQVVEKKTEVNKPISSSVQLTAEIKKTEDLAPPKRIEPSVVKKETTNISSGVTKTDTEVIVYKLQLVALSKKKALTDPVFKGLKVDLYEEGGFFKYTYGNTSDYQKILVAKKEIASKFPAAIIIAFKNGQKIALQTH
jgi:N-acetylmuramoyl-L-alanine amidase